MKISRKVVITIVAYGLTTVVGFLGTIYFANVLGPGPLGTFALGMTMVKWLELTDFGLGGAMAKRVSEMKEEGAYLTASLVARAIMVAVLTLGILVARERVNAYVGGEYALLITLLFALVSGYTFVARGLVGTKQTHVKNGVDSIERILRVLFQAALVLAGLSTLALYWGYLASVAVAAIVGGFLFYRTGIRPTRPERRHFRSLNDYAKFNVLTRIRNRSFSWFDVLFLGFFVTNDAVGIYQVTWNVALTFWLVSNAISSNLFPELSHLSTRDRSERVRELLKDGLTYAGAVPIPGLVGAALVGRGVLRLYGPEFVIATDLLLVVALLALIKSYEQQVLTALNSLDRPDLAFRVNVAFVVTNVVLNLLLIPLFELIGAAIATALAVAVSLGYAWYYLRMLVNLGFPTGEMGYQALAAAVMGLAVLVLRTVLDTTDPIPLVAVVVAGACVYFGVLFLVSRKFRTLALDLWGDVPLA